MTETPDDPFQMAFIRSGDLLERLETRLTTVQTTLTALDEVRGELESDGILSESMLSELYQKLDKAEDAVKSGNPVEGHSTAIEVSEDLSRMTTELNRTLERIRQMMERASMLSRWSSQAVRANDDLKILESDVLRGKFLQVSDELDKIHNELETLWNAGGDIGIELKQEHGRIRQGIWGAVRITLTSNSDIPMEILGFDFPPEIAIKGVSFPIWLDNRAKITVDVGLSSSDAGVYPISVIVRYRLPWSSTTMTSRTQAILSVNPTQIHDAPKRVLGSSASSTQPQIQTCAKCGRPQESNWRKCPYCGSTDISRSAPREGAPRVCPSCKKSMKPAWTRCPYCATIINDGRL